MPKPKICKYGISHAFNSYSAYLRDTVVPETTAQAAQAKIEGRNGAAQEYTRRATDAAYRATVLPADMCYNAGVVHHYRSK